MATLRETKPAITPGAWKVGVTDSAEAGDAPMNQALDLGEQGGRMVKSAPRRGENLLSRDFESLNDVSDSLTEAGYGEGRWWLETSLRVADLCREARAATAADVQALTATYSHLGVGFTRIHNAFLDLVQKSLDRAKRQPEDLLRCRSVAEVAEIQRDLYQSGVEFMLEMSTTVVHLGQDTARDAARPLEARANARAPV